MRTARRQPAFNPHLKLLRQAAAGLLLAWAPLSALPQAASAPQPVIYSGTSLDDRRFQWRLDDGRVRVLMFWRTDCAVCMNKMPELRANAEGWRGKPFDLVLINTDARREEAQAYDRLRRDLSAGHGPLLSTWVGDVNLPAAWKPTGRLPLTLVIDRQGKVAARHEGRVPPELWDQVAELLP